MVTSYIEVPVKKIKNKLYILLIPKNEFSTGVKMIVNDN